MMAKQKGALPVPDGVKNRPDAREVFRAWLKGEDLEVAFIRAFDDPACWGVFLVDLAKQIAQVYGSEGICDEMAAMHTIRRFFDAEWQRQMEGQFVE